MSCNPYLFIVGCPRSGTTLLKRIINAHPLIAIPHESHWIPRWYERRRGLTREGFITSDLVSSLLEYPRFKRLGFDRKDLEVFTNSHERVSYSTFVTSVFDLYGKIQNKPLVGDKTPGYARRIPVLHSLWPEARFIHLIRDGRNVCLSAINWRRKAKDLIERFPTWNEDPVTTAALWWEYHVRLAREAGTALGSDLYREVRYESLVTNPAEECKRLCAFLKVPYDESILRFNEQHNRTKADKCTKHSWLPITPGLRDWRTQMTDEDIERFEIAVGDLLEELNYPRTVRCPKPKAQIHSSTIRDLFAQAIRPRTGFSQENKFTTAKSLSYSILPLSDKIS